MYSTNSSTTTRSDLHEVRRVERINRPQTANQPFSRFSAPASERKAAALLIEQARARRLAMVAAATEGDQPA